MDPVKEIEDALNSQLAEIRAHQLVLTAVIGQIAMMADDWQQRLHALRANSVTAVERFQFSSGDPKKNEAAREQMKHHVEALFRTAQEALQKRDQKK